MKIEPFKVEQWMNDYEVGARFNIAETCVDSVSIDELFEIAGADKNAFLNEFCARRLTYGDIEGASAFRAGVWLLCDEVCRHLTQEDEWPESVADLYERGISVSSMSKVFSLAGLRLGWIAAGDAGLVKSCLSHRDYDLVSSGLFDEAAAAVSVAHADRLLVRNRAIVRGKLALLDEWVAGEPHVSYVKLQAGTTALVYYDLPIGSREFCDGMYHTTGAFVTPGECFEEEGACDSETLKAALPR